MQVPNPVLCHIHPDIVEVLLALQSYSCMQVPCDVMSKEPRRNPVLDNCASSLCLGTGLLYEFGGC